MTKNTLTSYFTNAISKTKIQDRITSYFIKVINEYLHNSIATGIGYDLHILTDNRKLILGGIEVPYSKGLDGHSDADVVIHAIVDSILGALNLGDIGDHFSPSLDKWKNADSKLFLIFCKDRLKERNAKIANIDVTIICQEPKLSEYKKDIANNIANILNISPSKVSIKATTNEKMDAIGQKKAIATFASSMIIYDASTKNINLNQE